MASCSSYSLLFPSPSPSLPIPLKGFPILCSMIHSRRQHPVVLKEKSTGGFLGFSDMRQQKGFGCSIHLLERNSWFGSIRRRCNKGWPGGVKEKEILKFMDGSENPKRFPTKKDLFNAGRGDLAEAIQKNVELSKNERVNGKKLKRFERNLDLLAKILKFMEGSDNPSKFPTKEDLINAGRGDLVEDIEKDGMMLSMNWDMKEEDINDERVFAERENEIAIQTLIQLVHRFSDKIERVKGKLKRFERNFDIKEEGLNDQRVFAERNKERAIRTLFQFIYCFLEEKEKGHLSCKNDCYDDELKLGSLMASEIGLDVATDNIVVQKNVNETEEERSCENWFQSCFQHLELELASILQSLKSASAIDISTLKGIEFSDAWKFKETEVMNARNKLRSICAKLAILEGKVAQATIESDKNLEMKQKSINDGQLGLSTLRNACIVWPNNKALEVLVCGSFDGWTSQRMMERSDSGFFILNLKLYPGRYEFKFIVDGVWKIDPLRPIASNNGYESNVMVVS